MGPRLRLVLLFSLALNLALLVALGLIWWQHGHSRSHGFGGSVRMPHVHMLERVLPAADHAALQAAYSTHRPSVHASFTAVRASKLKVRAALLAEPFDRAALDDALSAMRGDEQGVATAAHALLSEVASSISAEGRKALARIVTTRRLWHGGRGRHDHAQPAAEVGGDRH